MRPVWFDLEQSLYLNRKDNGKGLRRVDLSPLAEIALVRAWEIASGSLPHIDVMAHNSVLKKVYFLCFLASLNHF